ncbi:CUB and sushi domain-containing protein 3 [Forsythia ovata]|uniref:CUB and sushi domain-containing protein 3 n=1 Tax=Forsythia ovata TaxID=205694 RepID=A0ABD1VJH5_9LAMI
MGLGNAGALVILVAISMFGIGLGNKNFSGDWNGNWNHTAGWPYGHPNANQTSKRIIVGGSENWRFGFNYTDWAIRNGPFYMNDTLDKMVHKDLKINLINHLWDVYGGHQAGHVTWKHLPSDEKARESVATETPLVPKPTTPIHHSVGLHLEPNYYSSMDQKFQQSRP